MNYEITFVTRPCTCPTSGKVYKYSGGWENLNSEFDKKRREQNVDGEGEKEEGRKTEIESERAKNREREWERHREGKRQFNSIQKDMFYWHINNYIE